MYTALVQSLRRDIVAGLSTQCSRSSHEAKHAFSTGWRPPQGAVVKSNPRRLIQSNGRGRLIQNHGYSTGSGLGDDGGKKSGSVAGDRVESEQGNHLRSDETSEKHHQTGPDITWWGPSSAQSNVPLDQRHVSGSDENTVTGKETVGSLENSSTGKIGDYVLRDNFFDDWDDTDVETPFAPRDIEASYGEDGEIVFDHEKAGSNNELQSGQMPVSISEMEPSSALPIHRATAERVQERQQHLESATRSLHKFRAEGLEQMLPNEKVADLLDAAWQDVVPRENGIGSHGLPISPLMDPDLISARERHRAQKPKNNGQYSDFEKKLAMNPYAQALATPVRSCRITNLRLPSAFMLPFTVHQDPKTGFLWEVPDAFYLDGRERPFLDHSKGSPSPFDLVTPHSNSQTSAPVREAPSSVHAKTAGSSNEGSESEARSTVDDNSKQTKTEESGYFPTAPTSAKVSASRGYVLLSFATLSLASSIPRSKFYGQAAPLRWRDELQKALTKVIWRPDMQDFVLSLMRRKVARHLAFLALHVDGAVVRLPWTGAIDASVRHSVSGSADVAHVWWDDYGNLGQDEGPNTQAILYFGSVYEQEVRHSWRFSSRIIDSRTETQRPLQMSLRDNYPTAKDLYEGPGKRPKDRTMPLFDMQTLLGEEEYLWLRDLTKIIPRTFDQSPLEIRPFGTTAFRLRGGLANVEALTWLWKLQLYFGKIIIKLDTAGDQEAYGEENWMAKAILQSDPTLETDSGP